MNMPEEVTTHSDQLEVNVKLSIKGFTPGKKGEKQEWDLNIGGGLTTKHFAKVAGAVLVSSIEQMLNKFASHIKDSVATPQEMERELGICKDELFRMSELLKKHMLHPEHGK
jgi:hypothetical protein